jgi:hypothetical protein
MESFKGSGPMFRFNACSFVDLACRKRMMEAAGHAQDQRVVCGSCNAEIHLCTEERCVLAMDKIRLDACKLNFISFM